MKSKINFFKNRLILNLDYSKKRICTRGYPIEITVELTNWCNLDCVFCPHSKMKREQGFMDIHLFKKIINEASGFVESIDLDIMGESALHPQIFEMIQYCKNSGLRVALNSNMTKVNLKTAKALINSGLDILVMSIDAAHKETYESIRKGACYEETKRNIENLLRLDAKHLYKVVQMVYCSINKDETKEFVRNWRNKGADFIRVQPYQNIEKQNITLNALPSYHRISRKPCVQPWRKIAICWDGTAVLCCNDYDKFQIIGDINKQSIFDIWNGKCMREFRKKLISQNWEGIDFCKNCFSFEPNKIILWGSTFVNPIQIRKLLFILEKLMVFHQIYFFRYF